MYIPELERLLRAGGGGGGGGPPRRTGWQQSGQLTVGGAGTPVSMQFDFGEGDTYTCGFIQPVVLGNDPTVRCEALVMWNVEGTFKPVRVSVVGGMSVTAAARGVKIILTDATPTNRDYAPAGAKYDVSVQVARGTRGSSTVGPYYVPQSLAAPIVVAAGGTQTVSIPYDAGVQSFRMTVTPQLPGGTSPAIGDLVVQQTAASPNNIGPAASPVGTFDPIREAGSWIPIQPGCNEIVITNNNATHNFQFTIVFGVDG